MLALQIPYFLHTFSFVAGNHKTWRAQSFRNSFRNPDLNIQHVILLLSLNPYPTTNYLNIRKGFDKKGLWPLRQ